MKKSKMFSLIGLLILFLGILFSFQKVRSGVNEEIVLVKNPILFGESGVVETPITNGSSWKVFTTEAYRFSLLPEKHWESIENVKTTSGDTVGIVYTVYTQIKKGGSSKLYEYFGVNWYNIVSDEIKNDIRSEIGAYSHIQLSCEQNIIRNIEKNVANQMGNYFSSYDMPILLNSIHIEDIK